jgi:hypothetical protein
MTTTTTTRRTTMMTTMTMTMTTHYKSLYIPDTTSFGCHAFLLDNFWYLLTAILGQLPSPPKSTPTYLKRDESVRGGVTLPIPPTNKNTTQKYLHNKKETTLAICSRCHRRCRHRSCAAAAVATAATAASSARSPPPPSPPTSPPSPSLALLLALSPPHIISHVITHVVAHHCPPLTPNNVAKVVAHRYCCCSPLPPSRMSKR